MTDAQIIHCLHEGRAICGKPGIPGDWPPGIVWEGLREWPKTIKEHPELVCLECVHTYNRAEGCGMLR